MKKEAAVYNKFRYNIVYIRQKLSSRAKSAFLVIRESRKNQRN